MRRIILLMHALAAYSMSASYCDLAGTEIYAQDKSSGLGTFLGIVSDNPYLSESIMNKYGVYGSKYSSTSILNEFGNYGGKYSSYSPYNPYTTTPPVILGWDDISKQYFFVAYLTKNKFIGDTHLDPDLMFADLASGCGGSHVPPVLTKPDLIIDSLVVAMSKNKDSIHVGYIIANMGGAVANRVAALATTESLRRIDTAFFGPLSPGMYYANVTSFKIDSDTTIVLVVADPLKWIDEESEDNNFGDGGYLTPTQSTEVRKRIRPKAVQIPLRPHFDLLGRRKQE